MFEAGLTWDIEDLLDGDLEECLERCYEMDDDGNPIEDELYFEMLAKDSGL